MKIVVDDKIPYIREVLQQIADVLIVRPGAEICNADVNDADALIVRTRTRCDEKLLGGSRVKFVATATIGFDHIDTDYLRRAGITWMNCPGCNAGSVAQYVQSVLLLLKHQKNVDLSRLTLGIVGCGHVGSKVFHVAQAMGMKTLVCDPPLQESGSEGQFVDMETIEKECDVITFHVPLTKTGGHATYHLADERFFDRLSRQPIIINTSRGSVVDNEALKHAIIYNKVKDAVIDTWENEPHIDLELLERVWIGTPHIAGYSADGKTNADNMVIEGLCSFFGIDNRWHIEPPKLAETFVASTDNDELKLHLYNPLDDDRRLRNSPEMFESLRGNYPLRREKV